MHLIAPLFLSTLLTTPFLTEDGIKRDQMALIWYSQKFWIFHPLTPIPVLQAQISGLSVLSILGKLQHGPRMRRSRCMHCNSTLSKQALYCCKSSWMLAHGSSQLLLWSTWDAVLVWYFLYIERYRWRICANLASAFCNLVSSLCVLLIICHISRSVVCYLAWEWVLKPLHLLFLLPKTHRPASEEVLSCPGSYG